MFILAKQNLNKMTTIEFNNRLILCKDALQGFAMKLTQNADDALDLVQETYLKALKYKDKYKEENNFKGWLMTIMKNTFINLYRRKQRANTFIDTSENSYYISGAQKPSNLDAASDLLEKEVINKVNALEDQYRTPFIQHFKGYKYQEIADELNLPIGTVKSRIFYARKILTEQLSND